MADVGDRRPIAARNLAVSEAAAEFLVHRQVSPNAVSLAGMAAGLLAGACFAITTGASGTLAIVLWLVGALLVQTRLIANMLDGMVALGRGIASPLGELYNDAPDRVSDTAILFGAGIGAGDPALGLAAALAAMSTAYVRLLGRSVGAGSDFCGPMAKQQRMFVVTALAIVECFLPTAWAFPTARAALWLITILAAATAVRRLLRAADHLRSAASR